MLWYTDKKINTAFGRLRDRRNTVGIVTTKEESPEEEAERVEREMKLASSSGDIGTLLRLIAGTSALPPADFIKKTVGGILFMYYLFIDKYHVRPVDLDDLVDGSLYLDAKDYIIKQARVKEDALDKNR